MLYFNFTRLFKARGIQRPFSFMRKAGYSDGFATKIANNRFRQFNLIELERLCETFHCTPNDILEWIPNSKDEDLESHPLKELKRSNSFFDLSKVLSKVPLEKLDSITEIIRKEIEKGNVVPEENLESKQSGSKS